MLSIFIVCCAIVVVYRRHRHRYRRPFNLVCVCVCTLQYSHALESKKIWMKIALRRCRLCVIQYQREEEEKNTVRPIRDKMILNMNDHYYFMNLSAFSATRQQLSYSMASTDWERDGQMLSRGTNDPIRTKHRFQLIFFFFFFFCSTLFCRCRCHVVQSGEDTQMKNAHNRIYMLLDENCSVTVRLRRSYFILGQVDVQNWAR